MRRRFVSAMVVAVAAPLAGAGALAAISDGWSRVESRREGALVRFGCYTGAMFAFLPWAEQGTRVVLNRAIRRAEAYRGGIGLAFTYDPHRGCGPGADRRATTQIVALLKSFH